MMPPTKMRRIPASCSLASILRIFTISSKEAPIFLLNDESILTELNAFVEIMNKIGTYIKDVGLLAIRDEMVVNANQLIYLLQFK